ncbi:prenyltransferase/squalene oxidase repeat-containing protein [Nocardia concava]|uniref:prenyltransferase/squalene oxidase repeat-containing protein n=1 Tax=Nocardia concava TaxID=257281 RepID=UPI0002EE7381|nr:prenyltransferase/squalene oxidase repeat-containing protein [Nocardia concava]
MSEESLGAVRSRALMSLWQLIRVVDEDADGMITGSAYATAGVVERLWQTPRLSLDSLARLGWNALARTQNGDGSWGSPHAPVSYRVLPTLAVVCAVLGGAEDAPVDWAWARAAVDRGNEFLFADPEVFAPERLPGLEAIDLTIPVLLERVAAFADVSGGRYATALRRARMAQRANAERWVRLRARAVAGDRGAWREFPLELLAAPPRGWRAEDVVHGGAVSCSPVLTATALRWQGAESAGAERYLHREGVRHQGLWPVLAPVVNFERATAAALFARLGFPLPTGFTASLCASLRAACGAGGLSFAPGLPPDADTTAVAIFVLNMWDDAVDPGPLLRFPAPTTPVVTAHVLEALTTVRRSDRDDRARVRAIAAIRALVETQDPDGHWDDRSVASPCLPTAAAAMALARAIESEFSADALLAVSSAITWLLANQRPDGSWGVWHPTAEETACAVHALIVCTSPARELPVAAALRRAHIFLVDSLDSAVTDSVRTPLWHYKDLGSPLRIERLYTLTALLMSGSPVP